MMTIRSRQNILKTAPSLLAAVALSTLALTGTAAHAQQSGGDPSFPYGMGFVKTTPEGMARSARFRVRVSRGELPRSVLLTDWLPPVGNQGGQGSCAGWATGYYCYSYAVAKQRKLTPEQRADAKFQFSPAFLYHLVNGGTDSGSKMRDIFDVLANKGCATLSEMPYSDKDLTTAPSDEALERAKKYVARATGVLSSGKPANLTNIKTFLAEAQLPVVFAIPIYKDFPGSAVDEGYVYKKTGDPELRGYHAICCVGYDDDKKAFRLVNSWGKGWGDKGFIWVDADFIQSELLEAWGQAPGGVIARDPKQPIQVSPSMTLEAPSASKPKVVPRS